MRELVPITVIRKFSIESHDPDHAVSRFTVEIPEWAKRFTFERVSEKFHIHTDGVILGSVWISTSSTETGYVVKRTDADAQRFKIYFIERGTYKVTLANGTSHVLEAGQAYLAEEAGRCKFEAAADTSVMILVAPAASFCSLLPVEAGDPVAHLKRLAPILPDGHPIGRVIRDTARMLQAPMEERSPFEASPAAAAMYKEVLLRTLLQEWPRTDSVVPSRRATSAPLRRALQWIHANLSTKIEVEDLAKAAGTSSRTLQKLFRDDLGTSPIQYVIKARLRGLHEALLDIDNDETIASIAARYGLGPKSDFERHFKSKYGRTPSETRRLSVASRQL